MINKGVIVFGVPTKVVKDYKGSMADDENGPVIRAIKTLRKNFPQLLVCADVCMCAYTGEYTFLLYDKYFQSFYLYFILFEYIKP